ncbi:unnamed protein product [Cuscuta europaea]|uniref:Uncharacterized protein n=1 Tax=Cuscuta europaea TaxID=41803 RepID=A0A9P1E2Q9_CUSEU|nr:unnamed protein product [Cuscuta europaea]
MVSAGHSLLQSESVPERHIQRGWMDSGGEDDERDPRGFQNREGSDADSPYEHCSGILVHRLLNRQNRKVLDPISGVLHDDGLHVRPRHPLQPLDSPGKPHRLCGVIFTDLLLRQLRAKRHHLCGPGGDISGEAKVHVSWNISGFREAWSNGGGIRVLVFGPAAGQVKGRCRVPCRNRGEEFSHFVGGG